MLRLRSGQTGGARLIDFHVRPGSDGIFYLAGELDMASADRFAEDTLARLDDRADLILDLSELSFVDSTGVRSFLQIAKKIEPRSLVLRNPQANVAHLLLLVRIGSFGIKVET
jgi:anti-anti-sigma factor